MSLVVIFMRTVIKFLILLNLVCETRKYLLSHNVQYKKSQDR